MREIAWQEAEEKKKRRRRRSKKKGSTCAWHAKTNSFPFFPSKHKTKEQTIIRAAFQLFSLWCFPTCGGKIRTGGAVAKSHVAFSHQTNNQSKRRTSRPKAWGQDKHRHKTQTQTRTQTQSKYQQRHSKHRHSKHRPKQEKNEGKGCAVHGAVGCAICGAAILEPPLLSYKGNHQLGCHCH